MSPETHGTHLRQGSRPPPHSTRGRHPHSFLAYVVDFLRRSSNLFDIKPPVDVEKGKADFLRGDEVERNASGPKELSGGNRMSPTFISFDVVPNAGNGTDSEYTWTQTLVKITVNVPVPEGIDARLVVCEVKENHLKVGIKGMPFMIDGELYHAVEPKPAFTIEGRNMAVLLKKQNQWNWWKHLLRGDPEIDTAKIEPKGYSPSDLDPKAWPSVEDIEVKSKDSSMFDLDPESWKTVEGFEVIPKDGSLPDVDSDSWQNVEKF